jgi:hypothetical protein
VYHIAFAHCPVELSIGRKAQVVVLMSGPSSILVPLRVVVVRGGRGRHRSSVRSLSFARTRPFHNTEARLRCWLRRPLGNVAQKKGWRALWYAHFPMKTACLTG